MAAAWRPAGALGGSRLRFAAALGMTAVVLGLECRIPTVITWAEEGHSLRYRAYLAGRLDGEAYRRSLMGDWGAIQPGVANAVRAAGRGRVLVEGMKFLWGIPAAVVTPDRGRPAVWHAVAGAAGPDRVAIRFRQMDIRWIVYDAEVASWDRTIRSPYPWSPQALRTYVAFAKRRFTLLLSTPYSMPGYGMHWVYEVTPRPHPPALRVAILPGTDSIFAPAAMAGLRGEPDLAVAAYLELYRLMPDVTATSAALGYALMQANRIEEGRAVLRAAIEDRLIRVR
jgi:hypothetical protein